MLKFFQKILDWLKSIFFKEEMELTFLGLSNAGKTTLANTLCFGPKKVENTIATIGMNMREFKKGNVEIKLWDVGGQKSFRKMWERYASGCGVIVYVVDSAEKAESIALSKKELHSLISKDSLKTIPLLIVGNKNDIKGARDATKLIQDLDLKSIKERDVSCISISALNGNNIDKILQWILTNGKKKTEK